MKPGYKKSTLLPGEFDEELIEFALEYSFRTRLISGLLIPFLFIVLDYIYKLHLPIELIFWLGLFEAFVNQPYPFIRKRLRSKAPLLFINVIVDIILITVGVYIVGGVTVPFVGFLYLMIIVFNGILTGIRWAFLFAALSSIASVGMVAFELFKGTGTTTSLTLPATDVQKMILAFAYTVFYFLFAVLVYLPSEQFKTEIKRRKMATRTSKEIEKRFRDLFEDSKDVVYISDNEGRLLDINQAGVELFGFPSKREMLKVNISHDLYMNPRDRDRWLKQMEQAGYVKDFEVTFKRRDGGVRIVQETSTAVRDTAGSIIGFRGIMRDITEQKRIEQHLLQTQKLESLGYLAGGIAHDFNNILTIIQSSFSVLKTKLRNSDLTEYIAIGESGIERGSDIARRLLKFARIEEVELKPVSISEIVDELVKVIDHTFEKTITVNSRIAPDLPWVYGDRSQLYQMALNLCINARDAILDSETARGEGIITVASERVPADRVTQFSDSLEHRDYITITIADTGKGIDESHRPRIFDPFFTTKPAGKGTGLGLSVVYGIVKAHGGHLEFSTEMQKGTAFHVYLPAIEHELEEQVKPQAPVSSVGSETILIIEDEVHLRDLLAAELLALGYTVHTASDGQEGVEMYDLLADEIDLVILDMGLPKLSGREVYQRMKARNQDITVFLVSGYIGQEQKVELLQSGIKRIVDKPYRLNDLLGAIREQFDRVK
jgi:two-component system, cell cycle sensor histidine kinase and response regulator CckA